MKPNKVIFEKVLALVRSELWQKPLTCAISAEEVEEILKVAKEQGVSGLVANAIVNNQLPIGEDLTLEVCAVQRLHEKKNREMNAEIAQFAGFLNRRNLGYVVMKGQTMAALYPNPLMRSSGDIDFYCPKVSFEAVQKTIEERLGIVMKHDESEMHDTFRINGIEFEMHRRMTVFAYSKHDDYWKRIIEKEISVFSSEITINGEKVMTLSPTMNAVFIFVHLFRHFSTEGEGLRHFCDWALVLHREKEHIDVCELERNLKGIGHLKAYKVFGSWLVHVLGLPQDDFPFDLEDVDSKWIPLFTKNIMKMGNLGKVDKQNAKGIDNLSTFVAIKQAAKFFSLSPCEILSRIPKMIAYSIKKKAFAKGGEK